MQIKSEFPYGVREVENEWIILSDGTRLAARLWLPETDEPVPALLEYLPYRKTDGTAERDALRHPYFAGHGYASLRVDMRGSGDSDGILQDEYLPQEQDDALEVLAWIAAQPWCTGDVGMFGKSWGGFNCLQIAARRPPQLKAIVPMHFTDDRYADDVHYMGGCLLASQMLPWASVMLANNAAPPDPRFVGERWREMWLERMEQTPPFVEAWLQHQYRDDFWKHGSVCEDYGAIEVPVYAVGGWADAYNNAVPRLMAGLSGPRKALIGPWGHDFPETAVPGPAIGFLQEMLRWWDYWLKGIETGVMDGPMLRVWMPEPGPVRTDYGDRPGRWVAEEAWPSSRIQEEVYWLGADGGLGTGELEIGELEFVGLQGHGFAGGEWGAYGFAGELPGDQRAADGESLSFTSAPLKERVEIFGRPQVDLSLSVDRPLALVAVRLCDVAPSGESKLVSWGLLNLTHRDSHEEPSPLEPGRCYDVTVSLNLRAYAIEAGHRWRVSVSPTYSFHAWPSPEPVKLTLFCGERSRLRLPVRPLRAEDAELEPFGPAEVSPPLATEVLRTGSRRQTVCRDVITGRTEYHLQMDDGRVLFVDNGLEMDSRNEHLYGITEGDPLSASQVVRHELAFRRDEWDVRIKTESTLTSDAHYFYVTNFVEGWEGQTRVFVKSWEEKVERWLV